MSPAIFFLVICLFFLSGATALVYEVFWMKELGLLFGNTAQASAATLCAFFLGLSVGGYFWGRRAPNLVNPLTTYALLEAAIAVSVAGYFFILDGYHVIYPVLYGWFGDFHAVFLAAKLVLAVLILFIPAMLIGGTLPVISQFVAKDMSCFGRRVSALYAVNTLGAASGVVAAGFYLPMTFGYRDSYFLAMGVNLIVAVVSFVVSRTTSIRQISNDKSLSTPSISSSATFQNNYSARLLIAIAFFSGLVTIALQVLWIRMFSQVLQNSIYTFSVILMVFLLFLAAGALLAHLLMRLKISSLSILGVALLCGGMLVAATPFIFSKWTDGLQYIGAGSDFTLYINQVTLSVAAIIGPPLLCLGIVFPMVMKIAEPLDHSAGRLAGKLIAINTLGAVVGSVLAGFWLLDHVGLWASLRLVGVACVLVVLYLSMNNQQNNIFFRAAPFIAILSLVSLLDISKLPLVKVDTIGKGESLLKVWEGSGGSVAVIRRKDDYKIKVNNYYTLGGSSSRELEALQGYLPILLHPGPALVYCLGMGTGITAGAGLQLPIKRLVVSELIPEVIEAARQYFANYTYGLFEDNRVTLISEDARNVLAGTDEKIDVVIGDLFVPWKSGTGSLFTREHFQQIQQRLTATGMFMQWIPAYQISEYEFGVIARTMREVFPQVTLWRGDFSVNKPVIGFMAQASPAPLSTTAWIFANRASDQHVPLMAHYIGNLESLEAELQAYPVNTDNHPVIEFIAPITQRMIKAQRANWLTESALIDLMKKMQQRIPPEHDHFLSLIPEDDRKAVKAGYHLHHGRVLKQAGQLKEAEAEYAIFQSLLNPSS